MADNYDMDFLFLFKLNIDDVFWRLVVSHIQAWNLYYVLPDVNGSPVAIYKVELVVPTILQMGWCKSPPFFCAG